jgi:hypothetical protein
LKFFATKATKRTKAEVVCVLGDFCGQPLNLNPCAPMNPHPTNVGPVARAPRKRRLEGALAGFGGGAELSGLLLLVVLFQVGKWARAWLGKLHQPEPQPPAPAPGLHHHEHP